MEPRPRQPGLHRTPDRQREQRAERAVLGETARTALAGLFLLTSQGCDLCLSVEHDMMERQAAEEKAAREAETPEAKARREFKEKLVELEKAGYTIEISGIVVAADVTGSLKAKDISELSSLKDELSYGSGAAPRLKVIETTVDPLAEIQRQVAADRKKKSLDISIYRVVLTPGKTDITVNVENWLTNQTITTETFPQLDGQKDTYETWQAQRDAKLTKIIQAIRRDKGDLAKQYGALLTEHGVTLNAMDIMQIHSGHGLEAIAQIIQTAEMTDITVHGFKHDRQRTDSPFIAWKFNNQTISEMAITGSPELPGTLTSIEIRRSSFNSVPAWWHGQAESTVYKDKHGNAIQVETSGYTIDDPAPDEPAAYYSQTISISVPTRFLDTVGSETEATGLSVDLTAVGLPEITDLAYCHPERPVETRHSHYGFTYNIYYEGNDALTTGVYHGYYDAAIFGVEEIQHAFYGDDLDQQVTRNILIIPTDNKNGYFSPRNSSTITYTAPHLNPAESNFREVERTGRHETAHAFFNHLQLDHAPAITALHASLSPDFFYAIAEKNWEGHGFGGHPEDNPTELFASFLNSILVDNLETVMRAKLTPITAAEYAETAKVFREALTNPLRAQNDQYETIRILDQLAEAETIARDIAAGK